MTPSTLTPMMEEEVKLNLDVGAYEARAWARRAGCILSLVDPHHAFFLLSCPLLTSSTTKKIAINTSPSQRDGPIVRLTG